MVPENLNSFNDFISTISDTVFSYRIRAFDDANYSTYSDTIAWFSVNSAPSSLQLEQIAQDTLKLTWQDNSIGEEYFRIDRKIDEKGWQMDYAHVPADTTHFLDYNTALYDTCSYKIFAVSGISHSDSTENAFIPFLPAPNNLEIQALSATEVKLTWKDNCHNEEGYRIFFKRGEIALWHPLNLTENTEEFTDENVIPGIMNYYKICAYYENDTSGFVEGNINTLPAPSNGQIELLSINNIKIFWNDNCNFEDGFKVDRKRGEDEWEVSYGIVNNNIEEWYDNNVEQLYTYYYRVYGYISNYYSDFLECSIFVKPSENILYVPNEYSTIQNAILNTNNGDSILVFPGLYAEHITYNGKNITVASLYLTTKDTSYISQTIIGGNLTGSVVTFENGESYDSFLNGFTITGGSGSQGGGIRCTNSSNPTLQNLIIRGNDASYGGGIACWYDSSPIIKNVIIIENTAEYDGGGISCAHDSDPYFHNLTITNNYANREGGGLATASNSKPSIINTILWKDYPNEISISTTHIPGATVYIQYSDIENGWQGFSNLDSDPLFENIIDFDLHLQANSPCIDRGNPDPQYNDPDGSRNDMGAYGGTGGDW